jgi:hypothetical protein
LPIITAIDEREQGSGRDDPAKRLAAILWLWNAEPENVDGRGKVGDRQQPLPPHNRIASVRCDHQLSRANDAPIGQFDARHARAINDQPLDFTFHRKSERRKRRRLVAQEIEEIPLRHHRDERRGRVQMAQVAENDFLPGNRAARFRQAVMWPLKKTLKHPQFVQYLHRRRVDGVTAKIAEEVSMLFQHQRVDSRTRKQQSGHHPGRPAAHDHDIMLHGLTFIHLSAISKKWLPNCTLRD